MNRIQPPKYFFSLYDNFSRLFRSKNSNSNKERSSHIFCCRQSINILFWMWKNDWEGQERNMRFDLFIFKIHRKNNIMENILNSPQTWKKWTFISNEFENFMTILKIIIFSNKWTFFFWNWRIGKKSKKISTSRKGVSQIYVKCKKNR